MTDLSAEKILEVLSYGHQDQAELKLLQRAALEQARFHQAELTPALLDWLRLAIAEGENLEPDFMGAYFAYYLLAEFQEKSAFPLLIELFQMSEEALDERWGDAITGAGCQCLVASYDGDIQALIDLIKNESSFAYSRNEAILALLMLYQTGQLERVSLSAIWKDLLQTVKAQKSSDSNLVLNCLMLEIARSQENGFKPELMRFLASERNDLIMCPEMEAWEAFYREEAEQLPLMTNALDHVKRWLNLLTPEEELEEEQRWQRIMREETLNQQTWRESLQRRHEKLAKAFYHKKPAAKHKKSKRKQSQQSRKANRR